MKKQGKAFEYEIATSLRHVKSNTPNFVWYRIQDTQLLRYATANKNITADTVPSDFMCLYKSKLCMIECKSSKNHSSYSLSYIKEHQIEDLLEVKRCGGTAMFLLNRRKGGMGCWAVTPEYIDNLILNGKKSIKWDEINGVKVDRLKIGGDNGVKYGWNIQPMLDLFC